MALFKDNEYIEMREAFVVLRDRGRVGAENYFLRKSTMCLPGSLATSPPSVSTSPPLQGEGQGGDGGRRQFYFGPQGQG